ncbi:MAG: uracil-DNA glycosylase [Treponema sp.]|jgi:DNA polymerase|nr:uracil-DNA glycosylase [Treponema sp.]
MTAEEKASVACFIDLASDMVRGGYFRGERERLFSDDLAAAGSRGSLGCPDSLDTIAANIQNCKACRLCETRKNAVPGEGAPAPLVMVIGEAPGADEDASGRPFVGKAGQLLDKMLLSINLSRENNCFIANIVKCRPPENRDPQPDEIAACAGFLESQIEALKPRFILCVGRISSQALLHSAEPVGKLRGRFIDYKTNGKTIPLIATYHPSALLRNEDLKRPAWDDLKSLRAALEASADGAK